MKLKRKLYIKILQKLFYFSNEANIDLLQLGSHSLSASIVEEKRHYHFLLLML